MSYDQLTANLVSECKAKDAQIATLRAELANARAADVHSCHDNCVRYGCVNDRLRESIAEALRLLGTDPKAARAVLLDAVRGTT